MRKSYSKPMAKKVEFSYQDKVVANSPGTGQGNVLNDDNNPLCQFHVEGCTRFWTVKISNTSLFALDTCQENP